MSALFPELTRPRAARCCALTLVATLTLLVGCAPGADLPLLSQPQTGAYRLGGSDEIRVITFGEDQLTGSFRVDDQGNIALPLVGIVHGAGLTPAQLQDWITDRLVQQKLLLHPSVAVEVLSYRPIFVLGEVAKPGVYPYQPGMTMLTVIAVAGGFTYRGVQSYASDVRTTGGVVQEGRITPRSFVAPGDVIKVFERRF
ncbi:MAG: polysaccharide biosynthesis/export family protein [Janthinobacterium lividum]